MMGESPNTRLIKMLFSDAWYFLVEHKIFNLETVTAMPIRSPLIQDQLLSERLVTRTSMFEQSLSIVVLGDKNNPNICLESGSLMQAENGKIEASHDYSLDVSAPTFEEAIIKLAKKVNEIYGRDLTSSIVCQDLRILSWIDNNINP